MKKLLVAIGIVATIGIGLLVYKVKFTHYDGFYTCEDWQFEIKDEELVKWTCKGYDLTETHKGTYDKENDVYKIEFLTEDKEVFKTAYLVKDGKGFTFWGKKAIRR